MRSSPFGSLSHGHADQNAFVVEAFGEALAIASGYYPWYSSPHHHKWTRQTKAKNAITFEGGQGQVARRWDASGRIARFVRGERFDYALGDATAAYRGRLSQCLRHVVHVRPGTFVIVDQVAAPKPVTFEWWLHALEEMEVEPGKRQVLIRRGDARLLATFIEPQALDFAQTDQFDPPPESTYKRRRPYPNQWHLTASTKGKSKEAVFFTVLQPHRADADLPPLRRVAGNGTIGIACKADGETWTVLFGTDGIRAEGVVSDAPLAAVRQQDGNVSGWLIADGTTLTHDGVRLFESKEARSAAGVR
jgi:hypothetical protein